MWQEILAGLMTAIDVAVIYALLPKMKGRMLLSIWTGLLNILIPLAGFVAGEWSVHFLMNWSMWLSGILLALVGLHMMIHVESKPEPLVSPYILAFFVSLDTFSVSVSFGMLQLDKSVFVLSAGISACILSYAALYLRTSVPLLRSGFLKPLAGLGLIIIGIMSFFR